MQLLPFDLNLRHLRAVAAVVSLGSLVAAAEQVGLSQPALTQGLGKLERQIGTRLFDRRPDGMAPTPAGRILAERAGFAFVHLATAMRRGGARSFSRPEQLATATQLKALLALADVGSFTGAAAAIGLSQPAIHRAVRDLEQLCGFPLAERRGRFVTLTTAGRRIARGIRLASRDIAAGLTEALGDPDGTGRITIGAMPLSRALVLPHAIAAFVSGRPRAQVEVIEGSWRELADPLRDGIIDLMVGALRNEETPGLVQHPVFEDRLIVVARPGHPLAGQRASVADLARHEWVIASPGTPLRTRWESLFVGHPPPATPVESGSVMIIRGLLLNSDLLSLLSPDQVALELDSGTLVRIDAALPDAGRTIGITTRDDWRPSAAQARLVALIKAAAMATRHQESE